MNRNLESHVVKYLMAILIVSVTANCFRLIRPLPNNTKKFEASVQKYDRSYFAVFPEDWNGKPVPAVIALHGGFGSGRSMFHQTGLGELSNKHKMIVVFPDGYRRSWADGRGSTSADEKNIDDVLFIEMLVNRMVAEGLIDPKNVFLVGHSNGGFMAQRMAVEKPHLWRAVISVSSQLSLPLLKNPKTKLNPNVSVYSIVGTDDTLVPYAGGYVRKGAEILSAPDSFLRWKEWNSCVGEPKESKINYASQNEPNVNLIRSMYTVCSNGKKVGLYTMEGVGHAWPGETASIPFIDMGYETKNIKGTELVSEIILDNLNE